MPIKRMSWFGHDFGHNCHSWSCFCWAVLQFSVVSQLSFGRVSNTLVVNYQWKFHAVVTKIVTFGRFVIYTHTHTHTRVLYRDLKNVEFAHPPPTAQNRGERGVVRVNCQKKDQNFFPRANARNPSKKNFHANARNPSKKFFFRSNARNSLKYDDLVESWAIFITVSMCQRCFCQIFGVFRERKKFGPMFFTYSHTQHTPHTRTYALLHTHTHRNTRASAQAAGLVTSNYICKLRDKIFDYRLTNI